MQCNCSVFFCTVVFIFAVRLELVPELQTLLTNYESMSKRLAALEQVSHNINLLLSMIVFEQRWRDYRSRETAVNQLFTQ